MLGASCLSVTIANLLAQTSYSGVRQVSQESLVGWAKYSVATLFYCF